MSNPSTGEEEDNDNEECLSNHTISMRAALKHCRELLDSHSIAAAASTLLSPPLHETALDAWNAAQSISSQRDDALEEVSKDSTIPVVEYLEDMSVLDFRKRFLHANRPCLIRGLDRSKDFCQVSYEWRTEKSQVNKEWFEKYIGEDTEVPVRQQASEVEGLDEENRANECTTVLNMTLREWCQTTDSPHLYLKDWHFQKWWQQHYPTKPQLYTVPPLFRNDLLNKLLLQYTEGDYRFVYWGPTGSETRLHSDVLHSFSWSYNVVGVKKWTFYIPGGEIVLQQHAGELVFVPSTWTHKVKNLCETLSINHNWITTATIDYTWECLSTEMKQVDRELKKWGTEPSWDAKEFMLRGCVGLDVTAFFFMVITELLQLLTQGDETDREETWERFFDMFRLHQVLEVLLKPETHLEERMASVLEQEELAAEAMNVANKATHAMNEVKATTLNYHT